MNIYDALNQGDASLREPHFTSLLYYLFKETQVVFKEKSLLEVFIDNYFEKIPPPHECNFDPEIDLRIEEILNDGKLRRDTDIIIFLKQKSKLTIINIENKISNSSFQIKQLEDQSNLLKTKFPNAEVHNVLLLPFFSKSVKIQLENINVVYWFSDENSLCDLIYRYVQDLTLIQSDNTVNIGFFQSIGNLISNFSSVLEQIRMSSDNTPRGPRNVYRHSMEVYLNQIAEDWHSIFADKINNVKVSDLLIEFEKRVTRDLTDDYPDSFSEKIDKFKRGALEAQPKIMTINEKKRIHFGVTNSRAKRIFYYPESLDGNYQSRWKNERIEPLKLLRENLPYAIYWKDSKTGELKTDNL
jgi:hypothetical protein